MIYRFRERSTEVKGNNNTALFVIPSFSKLLFLYRVRFFLSLITFVHCVHKQPTNLFCATDTTLLLSLSISWICQYAIYFISPNTFLCKLNSLFLSLGILGLIPLLNCWKHFNLSFDCRRLLIVLIIFTWKNKVNHLQKYNNTKESDYYVTSLTYARAES